MKQLLSFISLVALFTSCNNTPTPMAAPVDSVAIAKEAMLARNKATALAFCQGMGTKPADELIKDFAPDITDYGDGSMKPVKGADSAGYYFKMYLAAFPDVKGENLVALADGNQVAVFGDWSGTWKKDMMGMKATGKTFKIKDVDLFTFNDAGKITEHKSVQSNQTMISQLMKKK